MRRDPLLSRSSSLVHLFIWSRYVYWSSFGLILSAFLVTYIATGLSGEATRNVLLLQDPNAAATTWLRSIGTFIEYGRFPIVLVSLVAILVSIVALFLIGRLALKLVPDDESPSPEFLRARARFFFLGFSLMAPPLLLSLFLSL